MAQALNAVQVVSRRPGKTNPSSKVARGTHAFRGAVEATTVLKPNESGKGIYLPSRYGETLNNRNTDLEDFEVTLEIARGCANRHAALKVALLENKLLQMWHVREKRLVVISTESRWPSGLRLTASRGLTPPWSRARVVTWYTD